MSAIGGPRMASAGCELWYPLEKLAVRGFVEVLPRVPELVRIRRDLFRRLRQASAPLFIGIDAPDFNLGLERRLKRQGVRTMHYVSPSVWAWRRERIDAIARAADRLLALFPVRARPVRKRKARGHVRRSSPCRGSRGDCVEPPRDA